MDRAASKDRQSKTTSTPRHLAQNKSTAVFQRKQERPVTERLSRLITSGTAETASTSLHSKSQGLVSKNLTGIITSSALQPKVSVGKPNDRFEREANQAAESVMTSPAETRLYSSDETPRGGGINSVAQRYRIDRKSSEKKTPKETPLAAEEEELQAYPLSPSAKNSAHNTSAPSDIEATLAASGNGGFPLAVDTQLFMEGQFNADFSGVRIHTNSDAARVSNEINAQAFTHGNNIYFNEGRYQPHTPEGQSLLAHELTHTIQQGAALQRSGSLAIGTKRISRKASSPRIQRAGGLWDSVTGAVSDAAGSISGAVHSTTEAISGAAGNLAELAAGGLEAGLRLAQEHFSGAAIRIPGYSLLSVILAKDLITGTPVERSGRNFIDAGLDIIPFASLFKRKLEETGTLGEAAAWLDANMAGININLEAILAELSTFWSSLSLGDVLDIPGVIRRGIDIIGRPVARVISFASSAANELLRIVKKYAILEVAGFVRERTRGYPLLTVILNKDPITDETVERSGINLIRGFMLLSADGEEQLRQMEESGSLQRAAEWIDGAVARLNLTWAAIRKIFQKAWSLISIESLTLRLSATIEEVITLFSGPATRIVNFVFEVGSKIIEFIKKALLGRLSAFARRTRGYPLVTVILGKDPFTDDPVEGTPENVIHGFISLMDGGEEQFQEMKETGAIARTTAWLTGAVARLGFTWEYITGLFQNAWNSLGLQDLAAPIAAFVRIVSLFAAPITRLVAFVWEVIKKVIEVLLVIMHFPVALVSNIITKAMQAVADIKRDPIGFLKNLLRAVKAGFSKFFDNILTHLLNGLTGWLFKELETAGITPPADLSFKSILGFILDVLGLSIDRIFEKLAARIGQEKVDRIRGMIDRLNGIWSFVSDVVTRGPVAIWEYIQDQLSNLWNVVLDAVRNWVVTRIIQKITAKLLTMLDPTGIMAVVNGFIAFYNAIQSFIAYMREMLEIVNSFVEGVAEIARGSVGSAANFLEGALARGVPVVIGFLANQVGLSGLGRRIGEMVEGVRAMVDRALDWLIDKAVSAGTSLLSMVRGGGGGDDSADEPRHSPEKQARIDSGLEAIPAKEATYARNGKLFREDAERVAASTRHEHPVFTSFEVTDGGDSWDYKYTASPESTVDTPRTGKAEAGEDQNFDSMPIDAVLAMPPSAEPRDAAQRQLDFDNTSALISRIIRESSTTGGVEEYFPRVKSRFGLKAIAFKDLGTSAAGVEIEVNPKAKITANKLIWDGVAPNARHKTDVTFGGTRSKWHWARSMVAKPLGPDHPQGGPPKSSALGEVMQHLVTGQEGDVNDKYIKGHLLNDNIGGPGEAENLFPITARANSQHLHEVESTVKDWVNTKRYWVQYEVKVNIKNTDIETQRDDAENFVDADFVCEAHPLLDDGKTHASGGFKKTIRSVHNSNIRPVAGRVRKGRGEAVADTVFSGTPELSSRRRTGGNSGVPEIIINSATPSDLRELGLSEANITKILSDKPFRRHSQIEDLVGAGTWNSIRASHNIKLYRNT